MKQDDEVEFKITTSDDSCAVTIVIQANEPLAFVDLLENLDFVYRELKRAYDQKSKPGVLEH